MFFMRRKSKFSQAERDEMIAFISRPTKGSTRSLDVKLIKAVERPGMGVPCPAKFDVGRLAGDSREEVVKIVKTPIVNLMFH